MASNPTEVELKLWVAPEDMATFRNHPHYADLLPTHSPQTLNSVYFDSDDCFLRDHGFNLRVRHLGDKRIQTIKSTDHGVGLFARSEWEQLIASDEPDLSGVTDTALGRCLTDELRGALKPVFETRFERIECHLNSNGAEIVMAIDEGKIVAPDASRPISEIELELKQGSPADLFVIARDILGIVPAQLGFKSKSERGYELVERAQPAAEGGHDVALSAGMSAGQAFTQIGRACLRHLVGNVPALMVRDGHAVHQMRVALRRLRAAISLFSPVVADDRTTAIKAELRWLSRELGPARDLDTLLLEVIRPLRARNLDAPGLVSIGNSFARKRVKSYRQAKDAVQSARFRSLLLDTVEWVEAGAWSRSEDALKRAQREMPVEIYASEQLSRRYKRIKRRGAEIAELDAEPLHRLRIQVKTARYATEFFAGVYQRKHAAKRCRKMRSSLTKLQNHLGKLNDIATHKALFVDIIDRPAGGLTEQQNLQRAFAAGLLIGDQQAQIPHLLHRARKAHARLARGKAFWQLPSRGGSAATAETSSDAECA